MHFCRDASRDAFIEVELFQYYNNTAGVQIRGSRGGCTTMGGFNQCVGGKNLPIVSACCVFQIVIKVRKRHIKYQFTSSTKRQTSNLQIIFIE